MIGFRVHLSDGSATVIEADAYVVDDGGNLAVSGGGAEVLRCARSALCPTGCVRMAGFGVKWLGGPR
jgi:hypothetical protein